MSTITLKGKVSKNAKRRGTVNAATRGALGMTMQNKGGSIVGDMSFQYINQHVLEPIESRDEQGNQQDYEVTITFKKL